MLVNAYTPAATKAPTISADSAGRMVVTYGRYIAPQTPWGVAADKTIYGDGVDLYTTASHGGFRLSDDRQAAIERLWPEAGEIVGGAWYEEDCEWALVALAFPSLFDGKHVRLAAKVAKGMPKMLIGLAEVCETRNAAYARRCEDRAAGWRVVADWIGDEGAEYLAPYLDDDRDGPTVVRIAE